MLQSPLTPQHQVMILHNISPVEATRPGKADFHQGFRSEVVTNCTRAFRQYAITALTVYIVYLGRTPRISASRPMSKLMRVYWCREVLGDGATAGVRTCKNAEESRACEDLIQCVKAMSEYMQSLYEFCS